MPPSETPLNTANQHAANADDYSAQGLLIPALQEHEKAAEAYTAAVERCTDEHTKRTLRMLYNDHIKASKDLQRKIDTLKAEGKDPALPQKSPALRNDHRQSHPPPATSPGANLTPSRSPPPMIGRGRMNMMDSQATVDESFMVLGQRSQLDPGDAFNQFWQIMEGMLQNLSQASQSQPSSAAVAFASAPLGNDPPPDPNPHTHPPSSFNRALNRDGSFSSDTDIEEPSAIMRGLAAAKRIGLGGKSKRGPTKKTTTAIQDSGDFDDDFDDLLEDVEGDDGLSESFFIIPGARASNSKTPTSLETLRKENATLKEQMEAASKRLAATEKVLQLRKDQDAVLRESIYMARREAQRAMGASAVLPRPVQGGPSLGAGLGGSVVPGVGGDLIPPPLPVSPMGVPGMGSGGRDREAQLLKRIRELEEETRGLKTENEKQKAMITKFRERWEKLKESAKRKKDAKAIAASGGAAAAGLAPVKGTTISEENEGEDGEGDEGDPKVDF